MWKILLAVLFTCVFQGGAGSRPARYFDTREYDISHVKVANPTQYHFCHTAQNVIGACLDEATCAAEGGQSMGSCNAGGGVCCDVVKNTCSDTSSSHSVRFQTPSFPQNETMGAACMLRLKIGKDICAVRMDNDVFEMAHFSKRKLCPHDSFVVIGTSELTSTLCGNMTSTMTSFEVEALSTITFISQAQGITPFRFSIHLTMVPCQDIYPFRSPTNAGMKNQDAKEYTTTSTTPKPTTKRPTTARPVTREGHDGPTPLPVGKIIVKPTREPIIALRATEESQDGDLEYDDQTPDSIFKELFESRLKEMTQGQKSPVPSPESVVLQDQEECYLYDPVTGQYHVNEACPLEEGWYPDGRVIGGKLTNKNEYPWQVALIYKTRFFCGGSLISSDMVLTAGHCIFGKFKKGLDLMRVSVGDHDMRTKKETQNLLMKVKKLIYNAHYNTDSNVHDIALLQLEKPVPFSSTILPVRLPTDLDENYEGQPTTVTGWGRKSVKSKKMSTLLKEYTAPLENIDTCIKQWEKLPQMAAIKDMHLCLQIIYGTPCHGDSGGPLVACNNGTSCTLIGVVSFGFPLCVNVGLPAVFTNVASHKRWIEINITPIYYEYI